MNKLSNEKLLDEYHAWIFDGYEAAISPKIKNKAVESPRHETEVMHIFNEDDFSPEKLIYETLPGIENLFNKYFYDVFYSPIGIRADYGVIRFNRLILPQGDTALIEDLLYSLKSNINRYFILNLIAETFYFQNAYLQDNLTKEGVLFYKNLETDNNRLNELLKKFSDESNMHFINAKFTFHNESFPFSNPNILRKIQKSLLTSLRQESLTFDFDSRNDYCKVFRTNLITHLYYFLCEEEGMLKSENKIVNKEIISFIARLSILCSLPFIEANTGKTTENRRTIQSQIKTTICRYCR